MGERAAVADGLARAFARGFLVPTSSAIAMGISLTADAAMSLREDGAPAVPLEDVARLLDRLQSWAARARAFYPVLLFLRGRLETLRGRRDEARRLFVLSAGLCADAGLAYHEARCRYELRAFGGVGQLQEAHRLFRECGCTQWVATAEVAMQSAASHPEPANDSWNRLTPAEVAAIHAAYPGDGDHAQIYDARRVRATLRRLVALAARQDAATQAAVADSLPAALQFVRRQLRIPESDAQLGAFLVKLGEDLPRITHALREEMGGQAAAADGGCGAAVVACVEATFATACPSATTPAPWPLAVASCLVCEVSGMCVTDMCLQAWALSAVVALIATALVAGGVEAEAI